ncbi:hypothetical protein [Pseudonocardia kunmingensis]|uniref:hypothetical protein n=1 Tax=Pseudonocardia kunmingensis TaxID=630975 RepID=UPI00114F595C|nr:hypothetical protein [Pseudonocardia kunmingensis]
MLIDQGRILLDEDADALRAAAVTVSGPAGAVEAFVAGHTQLHREELAGRLRVTVAGAGEQPPGLGLEAQPVSLQQLVVRTTQHGNRTNGQPVTAGSGGGELR